MVELHYTPDDVAALQEQPAVRDAVHWGLLVHRVGPVIARGRPELPRDVSEEVRKRLEKEDVIRRQAAYDALLELIHVPDDPEA